MHVIINDYKKVKWNQKQNSKMTAIAIKSIGYPVQCNWQDSYLFVFSKNITIRTSVSDIFKIINEKWNPKKQWNYHKGFVLVYVFISIENHSSNTTLLIYYNFPQITGAYNNTDFPYQETATDALPW